MQYTKKYKKIIYAITKTLLVVPPGVALAIDLFFMNIFVTKRWESGYRFRYIYRCHIWVTIGF